MSNLLRQTNAKMLQQVFGQYVSDHSKYLNGHIAMDEKIIDGIGYGGVPTVYFALLLPDGEQHTCF
ncbi:MAG: hypothetical protein LBD34_00330 [Puniceicoccales bacterium]|jgi:hypothetical protein|nr:hypothetical protein [Puniceicoccales bacterium]